MAFGNTSQSARFLKKCLLCGKWIDSILETPSSFFPLPPLTPPTALKVPLSFLLAVFLGLLELLFSDGYLMELEVTPLVRVVPIGLLEVDMEPKIRIS